MSKKPIKSEDEIIKLKEEINEMLVKIEKTMQWVSDKLDEIGDILQREDYTIRKKNSEANNITDLMRKGPDDGLNFEVLKSESIKIKEKIQILPKDLQNEYIEQIKAINDFWGL